MCGIAGYIVRDGLRFAPHVSERLVDELFRGISARGRDACGFVAIGEEGTLEWQKAAVSADMFIRHRRSLPEGTLATLLHTRYSTQGHEGFMENNHPLKRGPYYVVHNGHIHNDDDLFKQAERARFGQVDSEAIAALLAHYGSLEKIPEVMGDLQGQAACAFMDERAANRLVLAKSGNPLHFIETRRLVVFASTENAVRTAYKNAFGLKQGQANSLLVRVMSDGDICQWVDGKYSYGQFKVKEWTRPVTPIANRAQSWGGYSSHQETRQLGPGTGNKGAGTKNGNGSDPAKTDGSASRSGNVTPKAEEHDSCSVPDDGRPEETEKVHPLTTPIPDPAASRGVEPQFPFSSSESEHDDNFYCDLCEKPQKELRNPYEVEMGPRLMLCDDCLAWATQHGEEDVLELRSLQELAYEGGLRMGWDPNEDDDLLHEQGAAQGQFGFQASDYEGYDAYGSTEPTTRGKRHNHHNTKKQNRNRRRKARRS